VIKSIEAIIDVDKETKRQTHESLPDQLNDQPHDKPHLTVKTIKGSDLGKVIAEIDSYLVSKK
jgi:hypothetical protein